MITKENITEYIKYIAQAKGKTFDDTKLAGWKNLNDSELSKALEKLYAHLGIPTQDVPKYINGFIATQQSVSKTNEQSGTVAEPTIAYATPVQAAPVYQQTVYQTPAPQNQRKSKVWKMVLLIAALLACSFLGYTYYQYSDYGYAYALTDNIAIREQPNKSSKELGRMDMFGKYMTKDGQIQDSYSAFKIIGDDEYDYTKIAFSDSYWSWITGNTSEGYVHTKYIGPDKNVHDNYKRIFGNLSDDYNELDKLQFIYRKIIYNGIVKSKTIKQLVVKEPCFKSPKLDIKLRLSIAQIKQRKNGSVVGYTVIVQLSDDQYYTIKGDLNGEVEKLYKIKIMGEYMKTQGKFKYFPGSDYEDKHIQLKPCNSNETYDAYEPFAEFYGSEMCYM